jgi:hypothetical protein
MIIRYIFHAQKYCQTIIFGNPITGPVFLDEMHAIIGQILAKRPQNTGVYLPQSTIRTHLPQSTIRTHSLQPTIRTHSLQPTIRTHLPQSTIRTHPLLQAGASKGSAKYWVS